MCGHFTMSEACLDARMYGTCQASSETVVITFGFARNDVVIRGVILLGTTVYSIHISCLYISQPSIDIAKACRSIRYVLRSEDAASDISVLQIRLSMVL